jgi:hypothetical protein
MGHKSIGNMGQTEIAMVTICSVGAVCHGFLCDTVVIGLIDRGAHRRESSQRGIKPPGSL